MPERARLITETAVSQLGFLSSSSWVAASVSHLSAFCDYSWLTFYLQTTSLPT